MYCPSCGSDERQLSQYCRACGTDLRAVRITLEKPDAITESAVSARDHIGRAVAEKIRTIESARELHKVVEDVLPEIEKFLESPVEKRLRRLRSGTIVAFIGLGVMLGAIVASFVQRDLFVLMIPGFVAFFIGLGILANALMFTVPREAIPDHSLEGMSQKNLDSVTKGSTSDMLVSDGSTNDLNASEREPLSITEHTTHQLKTGR